MTWRIVKFISYLILAVFLVFFQTAFINALPLPWNQLNLVMVILFFVVLIVDYRFGLWATVVCGLISENYSPFIFGSIILSFLISIVVINFLFKLLFTNRSLFSLLILGGIGLMLYRLANLFYVYLGYIFNLDWHKIVVDAVYLSNLVWQLFFTLFGLLVVFLATRVLTKRFRSVFLVGGRR
ncbi:MAG: hypothetical protein WC480_03165 [Patescibacteria group bacterium]